MRAAIETNGAHIKVSDDEIIAAIADLGVNGIFSEPAGSAALAGLTRALKDELIGPEDPVLVINTGNGLKDVRAAMMAVANPAIIEPSMPALKKYLEKRP